MSFACRSRTLLQLVVPCWLLCAASGQRYIVDASGGGNFLDLPPAIAAVPDGATLYVRAGTYTPFSVQGKGLTIVGSPAGCLLGGFPPVSPPPPMAISGVPAGKRVVISGFVGGLIPSPLRVVSCAGSVVIRDFHGFGVGSSIQSSADVHLLQVHFSGGTTLPASPTLTVSSSSVELTGCSISGAGWTVLLSNPPGTSAGGIGMSCAGSRVLVIGSNVSGGQGSAYAYAPPGAGGSALVCGQSFLQVYGGSTIQGGAGGAPSRYPAAAGGHGVASDALSSVTVVGGSVVGGTGNPTGSPFVGPVVWLPNAPSPTATLSGTVAPSTTVQLVLSTVPNAPSAVWLGDTTRFQLQGALLQLGALLVSPQVVLGPMVADPLGQVVVPVAVPAGWPGALAVFAQFAAVDPSTNAVSTTGAVALLGAY